MHYAVLEANVKVNLSYLRVAYGGCHNAVMLIHVLVYNDLKTATDAKDCFRLYQLLCFVRNGNSTY